MLGSVGRRKASWICSNLLGTSSLARRGLCLGVLPDAVDRNSEVFAANSNAMQHLISELQSHVHRVVAGGGPEAVKRNRSRNKLLPRERIDRLLDPGSSFLELSQVAIYYIYFTSSMGSCKVHYLGYISFTLVKF